MIYKKAISTEIANSWNRSNNILKIEVLRTRIDCLKSFDYNKINKKTDKK
jgi:hypothetical protein